MIYCWKWSIRVLVIPESEQEKVFQPFYRGRRAAASCRAWVSACSIARQVAEAHGGSLEVESQPARGSSFRLKLPV